MSWKCEKCGQKLSGREKFCPECGTVPEYKCKDCGKELDNGKSKYCPMCALKRKEKQQQKLKDIGQGAAAVGAAGVAVVGLAIKAIRGK